MKVITGTIANIVSDGGYQSQNGYIYTFQMTIQGQNGSATGQIGSKSEVYPVAVGQQISVEMTETEHGVRFKKHNAQYAGQGGGGQTGGPPSNRDYDKENHGKCFLKLLQALIQHNGSVGVGNSTLTQIANLATACMDSYDYRSTVGVAARPTTTWSVVQAEQGAKAANTDDENIPF